MFLDDTTTMLLPLTVARTPAFSLFSRRRETTEARVPRLAATENVHREGDDGRCYSRWFSWRLRIYGFTLVGGHVQYARAAPSPFSLAAYIIFPIEGRTSFPLYVSIYNSLRKTFAARSRGTQRYETGRRGCIAWAAWVVLARVNRSRPPRNWCTASGEQCLVPERRIALRAFPLAASTPENVAKAPTSRPKSKDRQAEVWQMWYTTRDRFS